MHPALVRIARRNLTAWRTAGRDHTSARIVACDAVDFAFPPGPCVAFLFNPFGATVMRRWLREMMGAFAERPGELDILYVNNEQEGVFEIQRSAQERYRKRTESGSSAPRLVRLFLGPIKRSRGDREADDRILSNQPDGEYASAPHEDCSIWRLIS